MAPSTRIESPRLQTPGRHGPVWRRIASAVLGVLAAVLLTAAVTAGYAARLVGNTDLYVATVGPVIQDPAVQADLSQQLGDAITGRLDITSTVNDALSNVGDTRASQALAAALGPVIADRTDALINSTVAQAVSSQAFAELWVDANRTAHEALVRAMDNDGGDAVSVAPNGNVTISTSPMIAELKSRLLAKGVSVASAIPDDAGRDFTVFHAPGLGTALSALSGLERVAGLLPWAALVAAAAAVLLAPAGRRLRAGVVIGAASAGTALALVLALRIIEQLGIQQLAGSAVSPEAAAALSNAFLGPLAAALRTLLVLDLLAVTVLYAAGHRSRWEPWMLRHQRWCQAVAAGLLLTVLFVPGLSAGTTVGLSVVFAGTIIVLEILGRRQNSAPA